MINKKRFIILICLISMLILSVSCGYKQKLDDALSILDKIIEEEIESSDPDFDPDKNMVADPDEDAELDVFLKTEEGKNSYGYSIVPPTEMSEDWQSMQFAMQGRVYDWIGKPLSEIDQSWTIISNYPEETILPGERIGLGLVPPQEMGKPRETDEDFPLLSLTVFNPNQEPVLIEDATITAIQTDVFSVNNYEENSGDIGFTLPKGLSGYDPVEKMIEIYGQPDRSYNEFMTEKFAYLDEDKSLTLQIVLGNIHSFCLQIYPTPDYVREASTNLTEFSPNLEGQPYVNFGGKLFKIEGATLANVMEDLNLRNGGWDEEAKKIQAEKILEPMEETTYSAYINGFNNQIVFLRVANSDTEPKKIDEAEVIGLNVRLTEKNFDLEESLLFEDLNLTYDAEIRNPNFTLPVIGPFGVQMSGDLEEEFAKIPDDALEKEFAEDGGGYVTYDANGYHYLIFAMPGYQDQTAIIDEIMFTIQ